MQVQIVSNFELTLRCLDQLAFGVKAMNQGSALVHIYMDGSVLVAHGGTESELQSATSCLLGADQSRSWSPVGQGLYTKCCQIAAQELKVPMEAIFTSESSTNTVPNAVPTAGSAGSDLNGYAVSEGLRSAQNDHC